MKAIVDETGLSAWISLNGRLLAPLALVAVSFLIAGDDAWLMATASALLLSAYMINGWDCRVLFLYGIAMLAVCLMLISTARDYADWAAVQAYWLLAAGIAGMAIGLARAPPSPRGSPRARRDTPIL